MNKLDEAVRKDGLYLNRMEKERLEKAVFVGIIRPKDDERKVYEYLDELQFLAETAGAVGDKKFVQRVDRPDNATYIRICKQKKNATSLFLVPNECAIGTHPQRKVTFFLFPITFKFSVELLYSYKERYRSSYFLAELPQEKSAAIALSTIRFHASLSP